MRRVGDWLLCTTKGAGAFDKRINLNRVVEAYALEQGGIGVRTTETDDGEAVVVLLAGTLADFDRAMGFDESPPSPTTGDCRTCRHDDSSSGDCTPYQQQRPGVDRWVKGQIGAGLMDVVGNMLDSATRPCPEWVQKD